MKKILHMLKDKWPEYIIEALVIVASILGALALENWNEDRKERKLEKKYLTSIVNDLESDLLALEKVKNQRLDVNKIANELLSINNINPTYEEIIKFQKHNLDAGFWFEFVPNDNTFKELSNSGNLSLFQNDSIKKGLLDIESIIDEINISSAHLRRDYEKFLYDPLSNYHIFVYVDLAHFAEEGNYEMVFKQQLSAEEIELLSMEANQILQNPVIRNGWKLVIINNAFLVGLYSRLQNEIIRVNKLIAADLKND